jgi:hypothetical protein
MYFINGIKHNGLGEFKLISIDLPAYDFIAWQSLDFIERFYGVKIQYLTLRLFYNRKFFQTTPPGNDSVFTEAQLNFNF